MADAVRLDVGTKDFSFRYFPDGCGWSHGLLMGLRSARCGEEFCFDGAAQLVTCPFLMVHSAGSQQIPMAFAEACCDALGSQQRGLCVCDRATDGCHRCQIDSASIGVATMLDSIMHVQQAGR